MKLKILAILTLFFIASCTSIEKPAEKTVQPLAVVVEPDHYCGEIRGSYFVYFPSNSFKHDQTSIFVRSVVVNSNDLFRYKVIFRDYGSTTDQLSPRSSMPWNPSTYGSGSYLNFSTTPLPLGTQKIVAVQLIDASSGVVVYQCKQIFLTQVDVFNLTRGGRTEFLSNDTVELKTSSEILTMGGFAFHRQEGSYKFFRGVIPVLASYPDYFNFITDQGSSTYVLIQNVAPPSSGFVYQSHLSYLGWQNWKTNGQMTGTVGENRQMEAIKIIANSDVRSGLTVSYQGHIQNIGDTGWYSNGQMLGTVGQGLRLEAIKIQLGGNRTGCSIRYRAHVSWIGWQGWVSEGSWAGTRGSGNKMEALEIQLTCQ